MYSCFHYHLYICTRFHTCTFVSKCICLGLPLHLLVTVSMLNSGGWLAFSSLLWLSMFLCFFLVVIFIPSSGPGCWYINVPFVAFLTIWTTSASVHLEFELSFSLWSLGIFHIYMTSSLCFVGWNRKGQLCKYHKVRLLTFLLLPSASLSFLKEINIRC